MDREFGWNDEITEEGGNYAPLHEGDYDFTVERLSVLAHRVKVNCHHAIWQK